MLTSKNDTPRSNSQHGAGPLPSRKAARVEVRAKAPAQARSRTAKLNLVGEIPARVPLGQT